MKDNKTRAGGIRARKAAALLLVGALILAAVMAGCASSGPAIDWNESEKRVKEIGRLDEEAWKSDLDFLVRTLESRHPNPWHAVSREEFIKTLYAPVVPAVTRSRLARGRIGAVMKALALLEEGHTKLAGNPLGRILPLGIRRFPDGFYVTAGAGASVDLVGGRLLAVNGADISEVRRRLSSYIGAESEGWADVVFARTLIDIEILKDSGILPDLAESAQIEVERGGAPISRDVRGMSESDGSKALESIYELGGITPAESISRKGEAYWYRYDKEKKAVLVQYNACMELKGLPFAQFCADVFALIERERPDRLVLDLRYNTGGNSGLFTFNFLPKIRSSYLNRPGGIVVLIGPSVFSSGVFAVSEMKRQTKAVLAGEPTGHGYNHFGMVGYFMLPQSGLVVAHSTRYWQLDAKDTWNVISPDVYLPSDAASVLSGKDAVLEQAIGLGR